ncbi:MAG: DUF1611 domain-containing protein [Rubrobacteraceae bacterium]
MEPLNNPTIKCGFSSRAVPPEDMRGLLPMGGTPEVGDLVVAEVLSIGKNKTIEECTGRTMYLFPGDLIVGAFGNRYATDQFEGYVPHGPVEACDMLSVGGVCGEVTSRHDSTAGPTRLRVLGLVAGEDGRAINSRAYGLPPRGVAGGAEVILVVGSSMNSGKTTTAGTLARGLSRAGFEVAAAKVTGTAAGKDARFFESCGARPVLDFTSAGYPSTYMLGLGELLTIHHGLAGYLQETGPDYIVLEVADGIFQRETRMLLDSARFRADVDHVFFAAGDSLAAECGVRCLLERGLPLRATSGALTQSELAIRETEEATGIPCLGIGRMMGDELLDVLQEAGNPAPNGKVHNVSLLGAACG